MSRGSLSCRNLIKSEVNFEMSNINFCSYCLEFIDSNVNLTCVACCESVHRQCLKTCGPPGDLMGDIFFEFTCIQCSLTEKEIYQRKKLPW